MAIEKCANRTRILRKGNLGRAVKEVDETGKMGNQHHDHQHSLLQSPLLQTENSEVCTADGSVDLHGNPVLRSKTGNWKACLFILGDECCERLAFYGIDTNIVSYLTRRLHKGNVSAARIVTTWEGTCYLTPLIGAFLADAYWGRYQTIAVFSMIYFIGICALSLSASVPAFKPAECVGPVCPSANTAQSVIFYVGIYLMALGIGGVKPCVSSFGADQFDDTDPNERIQKGSFFNWFYFSISIGCLVATTLIVWLQENVGWGVGFGVPAFFMAIAIACFFVGTPLYRFQRPGGSPLTRIFQVVVASGLKCSLEVPEDQNLLYETPDGCSAVGGSACTSFRFLDKAAVLSHAEKNTRDFSNHWKLCTITQVEELKILIRMFPIWATGIVFSATYAQMSTTFVEQGMVLDRKVGSFTIPAGSLSTFDIVSIFLWVPLYDKIIVPLARRFTGQDRGFSALQRMGIGLAIPILFLASAALVEIKRLQLATELGLVDEKCRGSIERLLANSSVLLGGSF